MSRPQFTPGPWSVDDGGIRCDHEHNYGIVAQVHAGHVYSEYTSDSPTLEFENVADMHLIAAAPELFNGCNALLGLIQLIRGRPDLPSDLQLALDDDNHRIIEAQQAVAKAQGHD